MPTIDIVTYQSWILGDIVHLEITWLQKCTPFASEMPLIRHWLAPIEVNNGGQQKKRVGKGGAWRAWVKFHSEGGHAPDFSALSESYKEAKVCGGDHFNTFEKLGKLATGSCSISRKALVQKAKLVCKQRKLDILASNINGKNLVEQARTILATSEADASARPMALATSLQRRQSNLNKQRHLENLKVLENYQTDIGVEQVSSLKQRFPALAGLSIQAIPSAGISAVEMLPDQTLDLAIGSVSWSLKHKDIGLGKAVSRSWENMHCMVEPQHCQKLQAEKQPSRATCLEVGICTCQGPGRLTKRMTLSFHALLKESFKAAKDKKLLLEGHVVVQFSMSLPLDSATSSSCMHYWMAIPLLYLSPYSVTFHQMKAIACPEHFIQSHAQRAYVEGVMNERERAPPLEATHSYLSDYQFFHMLEKSKLWNIQFYLMDTSKHIIVNLTPHQVPLVPLDAERPFWPKKNAKQTAPTQDDDIGWDVFAALHQPSSSDSDDFSEAEVEESEPEEAQDEMDLDLLVAEAMEMLEKEKSRKRKATETTQQLELASATGAASSSSPAPHPPLAQAEVRSQPSDSAAAATAAASTGAAGPSDTSTPAATVAPPRLYYGRSRADHVIHLEHGTIAYYASKKAFEATCAQASHRPCKLTRTSVGRTKAGVTLGGRPVAMMAAWLEAGATLDCKALHWDVPSMTAQLSHAKRVAWRERLQNMPDAHSLLAQERPRHESEPAEAESLAGMYP
eukprot:6492163-Amphidinium_carterae.2